LELLPEYHSPGGGCSEPSVPLAINQLPSRAPRASFPAKWQLTLVGHSYNKPAGGVLAPDLLFGTEDTEWGGVNH
jgi:hypothetical protein